MMKRIKLHRARRAFALIELLICIILIGLLAGTILVSVRAAADKAEATKIVSDMRTVRSALLVYYANNDKWPEGLNSGESNVNTKASKVLSGYLDRNIGDEYTLIKNAVESGQGHDYKGSIFVKYDGASKLSSGVREQLAKMAPSANLWNTSAWSDWKYGDGKGHNTYYYHYYYTTGNSDKGINTLHMPVYIVKN